MNCLDFERSLDEGEPARLHASALAHARECARCERSLARARSLEHALERHFSSSLAPGEVVPVAFADRVMARVERGEARGVRWMVLPDALPWWVRVPAEPGVALAATLAALLLWRGDVLFTAARAWAPGLAVAPARVAQWVNASDLGTLLHVLADAFAVSPGAHWSVIVAMAIGVAPVLALAGYGMWRVGEQLVGPPGAAALQ